MNAMGMTSKFFTESTYEKWKTVKEAGFENIEIAFIAELGRTKMIEDADLRRRQALDAGLTASSSHLPFGTLIDISSANTAQRRMWIDRQKEMLDQIAAWQIPIAVLHASAEPIGDDERGRRMELAGEAIEILGKHARESGITLAVEVLPRTCVGNCADEILELTQNGRAAKVNLDVNHLLRETHSEFIQKVGPILATTHFSDYDFVDEKHWMPGVGQIDWKRLVRDLRAVGYAGQFMVETYEDKAVPGKRTTAGEVMESWKRCMEDA